MKRWCFQCFSPFLIVHGLSTMNSFLLVWDFELCFGYLTIKSASYANTYEDYNGADCHREYVFSLKSSHNWFFPGKGVNYWSQRTVQPKGEKNKCLRYEKIKELKREREGERKR